MATLETPPPPPPQPPPQAQRAGAESGIEPFLVPILLEQLQDDLARSRKRESLWMSLFLHAVVVIAIWTSPKWTAWFPARTVVVATPQELIQQQELTYLNAAPDEQKLKERPKTDAISDKDRVATSRNPQIDRHELKKILDSGLPGAPGQVAPSQQQMAQMSPVGRGQQNQEQQYNSSGPTYPQVNQSAKLQPAPSPFAGAGAMSPGTAIEQAARGAAANRGGYGSGGDYGISTGGAGKIKSDIDILSDTMGVDFGPYLQRVLHDVRMNWYNLVPEAARAPLLRKGKVSIDFAITKDGSVAGLTIVSQSGDVSLDRAALGGIMGSNPFPPLPREFSGNYLALRFHFFYNPDKNDLR
jgi:TonB family protein